MSIDSSLFASNRLTGEEPDATDTLSDGLNNNICRTPMTPGSKGATCTSAALDCITT
jgi:hypothetical protein